MRKSDRILLLVILLSLSGGAISPLYPEGREKEGSTRCISYLVITGESNVNRFSFTFRKPAPPGGPAQGYDSPEEGTELLIPVREFKASNPHMYNDFLQQMQESRYPYISIRFVSSGNEKLSDMNQHTKRRVLITLAGVTREYAIDCELVSCGENYIIKGAETLKLTDFHIPPPEKLNGLIKVRDEITVSFSIMFNFTSENSYAFSR
ncbi:MAG: YceI family protein [Bacteroidota bacterium]|jgi:hypothetical protein|nr:YceI family protein [Bacteroidota bacterium]